MKKATFITIATDTSNRNELKLFPVLVRYFVPDQGVKVKLLEFQNVPGETSEILCDALQSAINSHDLSRKVIGFCGDNCNTNFGGVKRQGQNNVYSWLKKFLGREIVEIGCGAHIVHNCIQSAVDVLPIDVEAVVVKIYKYFHIYTVRVTQPQEFCEFADVHYKRVLQHGGTRFLSLLPAIQRILEIFAGLKSFFCSQEQSPVIISKFFSNERGENLWFVHGQLQTFNKTNLRIEKTRASACDIVNEIKVLQNNLKERFENKFIPLEAKKILAKLFEDGIIDEIAVKKEFTGFYERCLSYIDLWKDSFADAEKFMWIQNSAITFPETEEAAERINRKIGCTTINTDELFDKVVLVKAYLSTNSETWKSDDMSCEEKCVLMMKHFGEKGISVANFSLVLQYIFSLPGTSAAVERVFSMMVS